MNTATSGYTIKPKNQVVLYIRRALNSGELTPNTKLPSERSLAEMFNISRSAVREALKTLETYGIIRTLPQSGSVIVGLEISALNSLLSDIIHIGSFDTKSLVEMRVVLEVTSAELCAMRHSNHELAAIRQALDNYIAICQSPHSYSERSSADFSFHRAIVAGSKNSVLGSMLMLISPDILTIHNSQHICPEDAQQEIAEHEEIFQHIQNRDPKGAAEAMRKHLKLVLEYAYNEEFEVAL